MGDRRRAYRVLMGISEGKRTLGRRRSGWKNGDDNNNNNGDDNNNNNTVIPRLTSDHANDFFG